MPMSRFSPFLKQCFVTAAVCCNIIGNAASVGYPGVLLPQLQLPGSIITLTQDQATWLTSVMAISSVVGNFISTSVMDRSGRRMAHIAVSMPAILSWFVTVWAGSFQTLFIGRILQGLSLGISLSVRSVLIGEYSSPKNRGAFLTTVSLAQSFGIFLVHFIGSLMSWQKTALVFSFFPFVALVMTLYSPESPSYLASKEKYDECREVFRWLRGDGEEDELEELIEARMIVDKEPKTTNLGEKLTIIKKKEFYKPVLLVAHAHMMMQFAGGPTFASYSTEIIGLIVGKDADVNFWMIALDTQRILSNAIAIYFINKYKRREVMFSTGALSVLSHVAIAGYVYSNYDAKWIGLTLINLQIFTVATGMGPLPNIIIGEVFPLEYRSIGSTISVLTGAVAVFIVLKTFSGIVGAIGIHGTYFLYALVLAYFLTVIWFLLPETKGRTLQQIEEEFRGKPSKREELEVRQSLQMDKRKMSAISAHSIVNFG